MAPCASGLGLEYHGALAALFVCFYTLGASRISPRKRRRHFFSPFLTSRKTERTGEAF